MKITKSHLKEIIKEELEEAKLPAWERPGYVPEPGLGPDDPDDEKSQKTNMNDDLREFAQWVLEIDGYLESLSGQHMAASEVPSDINLYDLWLTGASSGGAADDLMAGGHR